jgi:hypothetical protein
MTSVFEYNKQITNNGVLSYNLKKPSKKDTESEKEIQKNIVPALL